MKTPKILLLLLLIAFSAAAQGKKEQIKALKTAFITTELSLTSAEAEKFWPVYNAFEDKQNEVRTQKLRNFRSRLEANIDQMSDKEALALINQSESAEDDLYQNRKKLIVSLKAIISPVKILKLKKAEDDFNRKLLRQYRDKGPERP